MKATAKVQEQVISELVEVHPGLLVAKLNGRGDSQSIQKLARLIKKRIAEVNPSVMLIDLTDMTTIDNMAAQCLNDSISAARQPGIRLVLVGKHPAIHRKLTRLGVDLSGITACQSLAIGLWVALDIIEPWTASKTH